MWGTLIYSLRIDWSVNPQYAYGWAVPVLCVILFFRSPSVTSVPLRLASDAPGKRAPVWLLIGLVVLCVVWPLLRLIQQANPDWRLVAWVQSLEACAMTVGILRLLIGTWPPLFPIVFFLVAVPWPTCIELPLIQWLARTNATFTVALAGWLGVPALRHGSIIEVSNGLIGIEEPCSGIRSLQTSIMLALFLGEYFRLGSRRRCLLLATGLSLALAGNAARTSLLTLIASWRSMELVHRWHDFAGAAILVGCFCFLFLQARAWAKPCDEAVSSAAHGTFPLWKRAPGQLVDTRAAWLGIFMLFWLGLSELGVEAYYRLREAALPQSRLWTVRVPADRVTIQRLDLPEKVQSLLRYSHAANFAWKEDAMQWQVIFLEWAPGRATPQLARFHNPEVCLSASGQPHDVLFDSRIYQVSNLRLPFRVLRVMESAGVRYLFYCIWEDRADEQATTAVTIDYRSRLQRAFQGRRNLGQRALAVSLQGMVDFDTAEALFAQQLRRWIVPGPVSN